MLTRFATWTRENPVVGDLALLGVLVPAMWIVGGARDTLGLLPLVPLLWRRTAPVAMFTAVCVLLLGRLVVDDSWVAGDAALPVALYAFVAYGPAWAPYPGLATGLLGAVLATIDWIVLPEYRSGVPFVLMFLTAIVVSSWLLGMLQRTRGAYISGLEERAVRLETEAAQQAALAAAAERARIAREMHDVVAHSLSVMIVQADGALYASEEDPAAATRALGTISETGRTSLAEMRSLLGLLRGDDEGAQRAPAPGAADVPALVEQVRASGLDVDLTISGDLAGVAAAPGLTAYRVVQEALTNTLKHAGPGVRVQVRVAVDPDRVELQVDDDGRGLAGDPTAGGHGLAGVRERIAVHTGHVEAGPRPGGGFRVRATIPRGVGR